MMQENTGDQEHQKNRPGPMPQHFATPPPVLAHRQWETRPYTLNSIAHAGPSRARGGQLSRSAGRGRLIPAGSLRRTLRPLSALLAHDARRCRRRSHVLRIAGGGAAEILRVGARAVLRIRRIDVRRLPDRARLRGVRARVGTAARRVAGSASGLLLGLLGDAEGLAAEGLVVEGLAAGAPPVALVPAPVEPLAPPELPVPPELLCANAIPPDSSRVASTAAEATFMAISILGS